jgi:4-hydroxymandelate oxidase
VLCLTVDSPTLGPRNRQTRAGFKLPPGVTTPHLYDIGQRRQAITDPRRVTATWKDVEWLRGVTRLPLVIKGILDAGDAELALETGAAGLIVSNHGGRNLDTALAAIDALPAIVERLAGRAPVLVDGGIRRGTDIVKAIALGATAVAIGRPYCYGLSLAGSEGVRRVIEILRTELEAAMMLCGVARLSEIERSLLC